MNIERNISPKELRDLTATQNAIKRLHAITEATQIRKQINQKLLEAATRGDTICLIDKPKDKYVEAELISILEAEGFKILGAEFLQFFIGVSWKEDTDKIELAHK